MKPQLATISIGMLAGILYFGNAMINNIHAWPLVWPLIAGCAVVIARVPGRSAVSFWKEIGVVTEAGAITGLVFFAVIAIVLSTMGLLGSFGMRGLAIAGIMGAVLPIISGAVTYPIAKRQMVT